MFELVIHNFMSGATGMAIAFASFCGFARRQIVVSARDASGEKVAALDQGADDYVTSRSIRRRFSPGCAPRYATGYLSKQKRRPSGWARWDRSHGAARSQRGEEVHLTPKQFGFLTELAKHPGRVVTHVQLLRSVWGPGHERDVECLRVAARGARRKLESAAVPSAIRNEPDVGY